MPIGVYVNEKDQSLYVKNNLTYPVAVIIGTASKGPLETPTLCTSQVDFRKKFGYKCVQSDSYGTYAAQQYLQVVSKLYYIRIAGKDVSPAKFTLKGIKGESTVSDAIVISAKEYGSYYNPYSIEITEETVTLKGYLGKELKTAPIGTLTSGPLVLEQFLEGTEFELTSYGVFDSVVTGDFYVQQGSDGCVPSKETDNSLQESITRVLEKFKIIDDNIQLLSIPGFSESSVVSAALAACQYRSDSLFLVDPPKNLTETQIKSWVTQLASSRYSNLYSFGACYWAWQYIYDYDENKEVLVPPSVVVAPTIANSMGMFKPWYAPAGLTRGLVNNVLRSEYAPKPVEVEDLYETVNVNSIITHDTYGKVLWGQKTLLSNTTSLDRINVRMLISYIRGIVRNACQRFIFEPNDSVTWDMFEDTIEPQLRSIKNNRGLYDYKIISPRYLATDEDIDNNRMPAQILIKPVKSAEFLPIDIILTSTGVDFSGSLENYLD